MVDALDDMADGSDNPSNEQLVTTTILAVTAMLAVRTRSRTFLAGIPLEEIDFATTQVTGEKQLKSLAAMLPQRLHQDQSGWSYNVYAHRWKYKYIPYKRVC